jgi:hypothetical protein
MLVRVFKYLENIAFINVIFSAHALNATVYFKKINKYLIIIKKCIT